MQTLFSFLSGAIIAMTIAASGNTVSAQDAALKARMAGAALTWSGENGRLRQVMQSLPKGGDIHNHLQGAVYAESWIEWAAEDGLCADMENLALKFKVADSCQQSGWIEAAEAQADDSMRRDLVNAMSTRSYVPTLNWSGHNDFFETFFHMASKPERLGDALAEVAARAGHQNILYLELMETLILPELFPLLEGVSLSGDVAKDYQTLMGGPFGAALPDLVAAIKYRIATGVEKKTGLLGCDENRRAVGCDVEIRLIHQVIRSFPPENVFAQIILGWAVMAEEPMVVGINLVAPEDGHVALRDYTYHMKMIDYLYQNNGPQNVTLHAGELTLGLARPKQLRFHMWEALDIGHAKRLGHAVDVAFERDSEALVQKLVDEDILVEINLTSNDVILGISGPDHPIVLYRDLEVPYTLSTDDEGVSRIDLTHEYMRLYQEYDVPYFELKYVSRNALSYSFLEGESIWTSKACLQNTEVILEPKKGCAEFLSTSRKAQLQWELERRFKKFEHTLKIPKRKKTSFN